MTLLVLWIKSFYSQTPFLLSNQQQQGTKQKGTNKKWELVCAHQRIC